MDTETATLAILSIVLIACILILYFGSHIDVVPE